MCYLVCLWQCSVRAESAHAPWGAVGLGCSFVLWCHIFLPLVDLPHPKGHDPTRHAHFIVTEKQDHHHHQHLPPWIRSYDLFRHRSIAIVCRGVHDLFFLEVCSWGRVSGVWCCPFFQGGWSSSVCIWVSRLVFKRSLVFPCDFDITYILCLVLSHLHTRSPTLFKTRSRSPLPTLIIYILST